MLKPTFRGGGVNILFRRKCEIIQKLTRKHWCSPSPQRPVLVPGEPGNFLLERVPGSGFWLNYIWRGRKSVESPKGWTKLPTKNKFKEDLKMFLTIFLRTKYFSKTGEILVHQNFDGFFSFVKNGLQVPQSLEKDPQESKILKSGWGPRGQAYLCQPWSCPWLWNPGQSYKAYLA